MFRTKNEAFKTNLVHYDDEGNRSHEYVRNQKGPTTMKGMKGKLIKVPQRIPAHITAAAK